MTSAPPGAAHTAAACSVANEPLTAKKTTSHARAASTPNSCTTSGPNLVSSVLPAERAEAKSTTSDTGKPRSFSTFTISMPTAPVQPATPMRNGEPGAAADIH